MTVSLSTFQGNSADFGGGIHNVSWGKMTVDRTTLSANRSQYYGGGIFNGAVLTLTQSTLDHNLGRVGGGILNDYIAWVGNSTLSANSAIDYGGGVNNSSGVLTLTHSTLEGNFAGVGGGGLSNGAILYLRNTLMAYSSNGGDCINSGAINENTNSLAADGSCGTAFSGDPHLDALADNGGATWTCSLQPDSFAIDAGASALCLGADQRGEARDDWSCDIGAFELKLTDSPVVTKSISGAGTYTFGPTRVKVDVVSPGSLNSLSVTHASGDHPGHTGTSGGNGVGWGEYFSIDPNPGANNTFEAILSLPTLFTPDASDTVCRYLGGSSWDCVAHAFSGTPFNHLSRQGVSAFSDWAAGNNVSPTVVRLTSLRAYSTQPDNMLLYFGLSAGLLAAGFWVTLKRRDQDIDLGDLDQTT
jgi:hypothetical protein